MTALLTDNLPLLVGAPNGIKKLRELILGLAIQGKLLAQDEREQSVKDSANILGIQKRTRRDSLLNEFGIPNTWDWFCVSDLCNLKTGATPSTSNPNYYGGEIKWLVSGDIHKGEIYDCAGRITWEAIKNSNCKIIPAGAVLIALNGQGKTRATTAMLRTEAACNQSLVAIIPRHADFISPEFILLNLRYRYFEIRDITGQNQRRGLNMGLVGELSISVPPIREQHRIVAKVDELMALCDRMEARQADADSAHAQLVQALLDSLTNARDAEDFAQSWQRLAEHFRTLFTTESSIDALKQTLLQLAVMGKLVPQDPSDEPANELLKRISEEKARTVSGRTSRKTKQLAEATNEDELFAQPNGWEIVRFGQVIELISGQHLGPDEYFGSARDGAIPYLTGPADFGEKYPQPTRFTNERRATSLMGDILLTVKGSGVGKTNFVDQEELAISRQLMAIRPILVDAQFVRNMLLSMAKHFQSKSVGIAIPGISRDDVLHTLIGLPPLSEQHRIVAKVERLMFLCDQLKKRLAQARQLNEQLASTLVKRALVDDGQLAPVTTGQKAARTLLAAEVTHRLRAYRTFGQRKLQKVIYLAEHAARLETIRGNYLRNVAGPHDRQLMNQVEAELQNNQWYERIERDTKGHAYRPLSKAGQHRQAYSSTWSGTKRTTIEQVIELMRDWDTDRCEMTVTLYAAWNDFIIEGRPVTDDAIVDEVLHRWNDAKLRFSKSQWLAVLAEMKKHSLLTPSGFGKRTTGGTLTLPGFE